MKRITILIILLWLMALPVSALEIEAPSVPEAGSRWMPESRDSFGDALLEMADRGFSELFPEVREAFSVSAAVLCVVLMLSLVQNVSGTVKTVCDLAGTVGICGILMGRTGSMITMGLETVQQITEYGKLLLPVMTAAVAAQGGVTTSAALYAGTAMFNTFLSTAITSVLMPGIRVYLVVSMVSCASGEDLLKRMADFIKGSSTWFLKTLMIVFTTYLSLSGVVSGTTDAAALKAAKVTISSVVPVVGGILSDASEAVLVSAGVVKNAAGIYGILAVLAVFLRPFLKLSAHYLVLKLTGAVSAVFGSKSSTMLIDAFSTAMGLLLGVTGACCVMVLISTVCFMRSMQ